MNHIAAICGRALIGAFTGFAVMGTIMLVATNNFGFGSRDAPADLARIIVQLVGGATVVGAVVACFFGTLQLDGRVGTALRGMAFGGLAGVLTGPTLCVVVGPMMDMPSKVGVALGMFVGLPLGVFFGGVTGATLSGMPGKKEPVGAVDGVSDRMLDG